MTVYLTGEFREQESLIGAIRALRAAGFETGALDLFSAEPVELPRGVLERPSRMSLVSVAGAIGFGALATGFIRYTQRDYKLITGGMPVFSFWATGVITYEMTMLGAIVATFAWFLWESGLIRKREPAPVPHAAPGEICLRARCRVEQRAKVIEVMKRHGAVEIVG
jgi:hypothetical protein